MFHFSKKMEKIQTRHFDKYMFQLGWSSVNRSNLPGKNNPINRLHHGIQFASQVWWQSLCTWLYWTRRDQKHLYWNFLWREVCTWVSSNLESSILVQNCAALPLPLLPCWTLAPLGFVSSLLRHHDENWYSATIAHLTAQTTVMLSAARIASRASASGAPFTFTAMWAWIMPCFTFLKYIHQHARIDSSSYCVCRPNLWFNTVAYCLVQVDLFVCIVDKAPRWPLTSKISVIISSRNFVDWFCFKDLM